MPDLSGMDFIKSLNKRPMVIFTTAYSEYAIDGFKVDAIDYLLKPYSYADFLHSSSKAQKFYELVQNSNNSGVQDNEFLFVKSEYKIVRIRLNDIKYIEGMREYVRIHTINSKPVMTLMSMKTLEEKLPADHFMRVHRSFIVNLEQISIVERNRIVFDKDVYIPVSDQYKDQFQEFIDKHFMQ